MEKSLRLGHGKQPQKTGDLTGLKNIVEGNRNHEDSIKWIKWVLDFSDKEKGISLTPGEKDVVISFANKLAQLQDSEKGISLLIGSMKVFGTFYAPSNERFRDMKLFAKIISRREFQAMGESSLPLLHKVVSGARDHASLSNGLMALDSFLDSDLFENRIRASVDNLVSRSEPSELVGSLEALSSIPLDGSDDITFSLINKITSSTWGNMTCACLEGLKGAMEGGKLGREGARDLLAELGGRYGYNVQTVLWKRASL